MRKLCFLSGLTILASLSVAGPAAAINGDDPPINAEFKDSACMVVVDRSVDPVFHIEYTIKKEDTVLGDDEIADSRTHQFVAFSQQNVRRVPEWLTQKDVDIAREIGQLLETDVLLDEDVLETNDSFPNDSWLRITADEDRIPITQENADAGAFWDTTDAPEGAYLVRGYTWRPRYNAWTTRWGVVKVTDDAVNGPPAAHISRTPGLIQETVVGGAPLEIAGCIDVMDGSTATISWGGVAGKAAVEWKVHEEGVEVTTGDLAYSFNGTEEQAVFDEIRVKIEIEDPSGRTYTAISGSIAVDSGEVEPEPELTVGEETASEETVVEESNGDVTGVESSDTSGETDPSDPTDDPSDGENTTPTTDDTCTVVPNAGFGATGLFMGLASLGFGFGRRRRSE